MFLTFWNATIKWSHKIISTLHGVSSQLVVAMLSDRFYLSTSVFFFYFVFGFAFPLQRKYKEQTVPYIVGDNFSLFGQVEQKISWETFFNVTSKQGRDHPQSLSKEANQPLFFDNLFLRRVDLYPDHLLFKLNEHWRGVIDQKYTGFLSGCKELENVERSSLSMGEMESTAFDRPENRVGSFRFFARKEIDFSSIWFVKPFTRNDGTSGGQRVASLSDRKSRLSSLPKSYPLGERGWRGGYYAKEWFYTLSRPWDEIPFKLESDNILNDALQWGSLSPSPFSKGITRLSPIGEAEAYGDGERGRENALLEEMEKAAFLLNRRSELDCDTTYSRLKRIHGKETLQEEIDELLDLDIVPWEDIFSGNAIEGRSMSGHRCPDMGRKELKALCSHRWSQRLFSLRPFQPPRGGWQDFIQTIQIPLPPTFSLAFPHAFSPSDPPPSRVEIKYRQLELAGLKKFEALFRASVKDMLDSEHLELIPMEKIFYRGPVLALGDTGATKDVISFDEERSDDIYEWGSSIMGVDNPLATQQQNFFGKKSVFKDEPVTERVEALGSRDQKKMDRTGREDFFSIRSMSDGQVEESRDGEGEEISHVQGEEIGDTQVEDNWKEESDSFLPTKGRQPSKGEQLSEGEQPSKGEHPRKRGVLEPSHHKSFPTKVGPTTLDPETREERPYVLDDEGPENLFFSIAPVNEQPTITLIKPEEWNRMVEVQIEGAVDVRLHLDKFGLEFPIIPASQPSGRPFLWPLTRLEYQSLNRLFLEQRNLFKKMSGSMPQGVYHYAPPSHTALDEPSLYSSLINPTYQRSNSRFVGKKWAGWWTGLSDILSLVFGEEVIGSPHRQLWEPVTILSWMMIYKYLFVLWIEQVGKDFYQSYGKEILLYFINLLASLGFDAETLIDDLGLGEAPNYLRIIPTTEKRFRDLAGIDTTLPTLGEIVWFLRSSGRGRSIPKGFLLVGPPGTGKTFLVQAIAGEAEVPVVIQSASLLIDPEEKESPLERLKNVFDEARKSAPCILFIDEIDTLGASRDGVMRNTMGANQLVESLINPSQSIEKEKFKKGGGRDSMKTDQLENQTQEAFLKTQIDRSHQAATGINRQKLSLLMQLLVEMDGLNPLQGLVVIGATNRPGVIDPALLRPGRFEKVLHIELPGEGKRVEILQLYSKKIGIAQDVSWRYLAHRTVGFSAAGLSAVMNQSSMQAILQSTRHTIETIEAGIEVIGRQTTQTGFPAGKGFFDPFLPRRLAYYQAGKAVVQIIVSSQVAASYLPLWPSPRLEAVDLTKGFLDQSFGHTLDRLAVEARVIGLYAGKAGEIFAFSPDLPARGRQVGDGAVWDSDLGSEEIQLATEVGNIILTNWYFYSNEISFKERNQVVGTQNQEEIKDRSQVEFCKRLVDESEMGEETEGEKRAGYQSHSFPAWWQSQVTKEVELVQPSYSKWSRLYLPDPADSERNDEWVPPDQNYHATPACQTIATSERKGSFPWNEFSRLDRDYLLHSLLTTCFNEAFAVMEERREVLDYSADHLIRYQLLRRHTIQQMDLQFPM